MASKIQKTIARQQQKIDEGQYYEAHQHLRVIASRYIKSSPPDYPAAISLLSSGALALLKAGQGGSGGDLCRYLADVYTKSETKPDAESRNRVIELLRAFPAGEPTRKRFVGEIVAWSAKFGEFPAGDPELHHVIGCLYADGDELYEAERHLVLGTRDSPQRLALLEFSFYALDDVHTAPLWAGRAVLPYVLIGNLRAANQNLLLFMHKLASPTSTSSPPTVDTISSPTSDVRIYPSLPLLNFLQLLLLVIMRERGAADLFRQLRARYAAQLKETTEWEEPLERIAEMYFGIKPPGQGVNPLFDMMGSFLMGGRGGGGAGGVPRGIAGPPAPGLD